MIRETKIIAKLGRRVGNYFEIINTLWNMKLSNTKNCEQYTTPKHISIKTWACLPPKDFLWNVEIICIFPMEHFIIPLEKLEKSTFDPIYQINRYHSTLCNNHWFHYFETFTLWRHPTIYPFHSTHASPPPPAQG